MVGYDPSLDICCQNCTPTTGTPAPPRQGNGWGRQERRAWHRIKSGLKVHRGERLRFLTLTSAPGMRRDIKSARRVLKERIRRLTPARLLKLGYISSKDLRRFYPGKPLWEPLKFEYFQVFVEHEGVEGVYHILYFGDYIPQAWLSDAWREVTGSAYVVDIRACRNNVENAHRLASYCVSQYVIGQSGKKRFSWSWGWVSRGFVGIWEKVKELTGNIETAIYLWERVLSGEVVDFNGWRIKPPPELGVCELKQSVL